MLGEVTGICDCAVRFKDVAKTDSQASLSSSLGHAESHMQFTGERQHRLTKQDRGVMATDE